MFLSGKADLSLIPFGTHIESPWAQEASLVQPWVLPLYFASGFGMLGRHSVGTAIVGGMLFSTVLKLFFIPVLYVILKGLLVSLSAKKQAETREAAEVA